MPFLKDPLLVSKSDNFRRGFHNLKRERKEACPSTSPLGRTHSLLPSCVCTCTCTCPCALSWVSGVRNWCVWSSCPDSLTGWPSALGTRIGSHQICAYQSRLALKTLCHCFTHTCIFFKDLVGRKLLSQGAVYVHFRAHTSRCYLAPSDTGNLD